MTNHTPLTPADLSNEELVAALDRLARGEQRSTATMIAHLAELDRRKLDAEAGYQSPFEYCTKRLHLSDHEAYLRINAARTVRRYPVLLELLATGALHLTAVKLLAPHLSHENHRELFEKARHKTSKEVALLVAELAPEPDVRATVRRRRAPKAAPAAGALPAEPTAGCAAPVPTPTAAPRPVVRPLAPERFEFRFTGSARFRSKVVRAQELLGRRVGPGDLEAVFEQALDLLVAKLEKTKNGATEAPRPARPGAALERRHPPAAVRRAVHARDGGQCAYVAPDGRRCTARSGLEYHHCQPHALGGPTTVENLSLRCRAHNVFEAEQCFGPWRGESEVREATPRYGSGPEAAPRTSFQNESRGAVGLLRNERADARRLSAIFAVRPIHPRGGRLSPGRGRPSTKPARLGTGSRARPRVRRPTCTLRAGSSLLRGRRSEAALP
jgi:hypothetical protein